MKEKISKGLLLNTLFIALTFLWTGSVYLSWTEHLALLADSNVTYIVTEVGGYVTQIIGLILFSLLVYYDRRILKNLLIVIFMILDGLCIIPVVFSDSAQTVIISGMMMNLFHGLIAGYYITRLSVFVQKNRRGICFGAGYAAGSIGSYLLSLPNGGRFLASGLVGMVYLLMIACSCVLIMFMYKNDAEADDMAQAANVTVNSVCKLTAVVIFLLCLTTQLQFFFPAKAFINQSLKLEFARMFYAVGLILAAVVNDKNRGAGLILALLSISFSVLSINMSQIPLLLVPLAIIRYIVTGFWAVYRIVAFIDLADDNSSLLFMSAFGLLIGRMGEATGAMMGYLLRDRQLELAVVSAVLFGLSIISAFLLYTIRYGSVPAAAAENRSERFFAQYDISLREQQIFKLIIEGKTNIEAANALYISESTVKFHVKNLLRKTECKNRKELIRKFQGYS